MCRIHSYVFCWIFPLEFYFFSLFVVGFVFCSNCSQIIRFTSRMSALPNILVQWNAEQLYMLKRINGTPNRHLKWRHIFSSAFEKNNEEKINSILFFFHSFILPSWLFFFIFRFDFIYVFANSYNGELLGNAQSWNHCIIDVSVTLYILVVRRSINSLGKFQNTFELFFV